MYTRRIIFIVLSFIAIFIIDFDYVCGHIDENPIKPDWCPICELSKSTELGHLVLFILLFIGIFLLIRFQKFTSLILPLSIYHSISPNRAPPCID